MDQHIHKLSDITANSNFVALNNVQHLLACMHICPVGNQLVIYNRNVKKTLKQQQTRTVNKLQMIFAQTFFCFIK